MADTNPHDDSAPIDWEAFYANFRKPGFIRGFEILEKLGSGAFGLVYKARKESIGKHYAIKFLKVDDEGVRDAVRSELESVRYFAQVDHPNLVAIEDRGEIDGIPYIIMAYAGDSTLRRRIDAGDLGHDEALRLFIQTARGIAALHDRALVHFDIKPANVYLKGDVARVGDYGLSKLVTESCNSLSFGRGTPYYMAPEMLKRRGDHSSDIYSLGVLLFEMLVGRPPFRGDSEWEILNKHETEEPNIPNEIGSIETAIIKRCLAKNPSDRFGRVQEIIDMLAETGLEQTLAESPSPAQAPRPEPKHKPSILAHDLRAENPQTTAKRTRRKRAPISGRRAFFGAAIICIGTGIFISLITFAGLSSQAGRHELISAIDDSQPFLTEIFDDLPAPLNSRDARAFARDVQNELRASIRRTESAEHQATIKLTQFRDRVANTSSQSRKLEWLLENFDEYQAKDYVRISNAVSEQGSKAAPFLVDRMSELDYTRIDHVLVGEKLDKLLCRVLQRPSTYKKVSRRSKRVPSKTTRHNRQVVQGWHKLVSQLECLDIEAPTRSTRSR